MLPHLPQVLALSLDSLAVGVLAVRLAPRFAVLPYALAFGLSDAFFAFLGHSIGAWPGLVLLLTAALCAAAACHRLNHASDWRTAAGAALPLLLGLDSLACPVATADLPALALASTGLGLAGLGIGRAADRRLPWFGQAALLALACLALFA